MNFKNIIKHNERDIAFIVGNGINRHHPNPNSVTWDELLLRLWNKFAPNVFKEIPKGITITEFYDLLDLTNDIEFGSSSKIQKEAARILNDSSYADHHLAFIQKAKALNAPVLTTNFDLILPHTLNLIQRATTTKNFTDYYPWATYYSDRDLDNPVDGFGVWFINGFIRYHRSIRLGLSHYMGSVQRARTMIHGSRGASLYKARNRDKWSGANTWLHVIFNKNLCVFGLGLQENEVFIRWLLIERAKYFRKFPDRRKKGWFIVRKAELTTDTTLGQKYFLESVGLELVETEDYEEIYETAWNS